MDIQIAERLQKTRKSHGFSQEELADKLGVSRQAVSKWERGEASPDTDNLIALAKLYNITVDELLFESGIDTQADEEEREDEVSQNEICDENPDDVRDVANGIITGTVSSATVIASLIAYLVMGCVWGLWHPGWIVFLSIIIIPTLAEAIIARDLNIFCYPVLATAVYLIVGFVCGIWHPTWVIFLTIPLYYAIVDCIVPVIKKKK